MLRQPVASATRWLLAGGGKDSSAAFQELADHFTYIGKPHLRGALSVSADGMSLQYTSPHKDGLVVIFF